MIRLLTCLLLLVLVGCGQPGPRCINPDAPVAIYVASRPDLVAELIRRGGDYIPNATRQDGFYDRELKQIWIVGKPSDAAVLRPFAHELLRHYVDDQGGDALTALARITSPRWDVLYSDSPPVIHAAAKALSEAHRNGVKP